MVKTVCAGMMPVSSGKFYLEIEDFRIMVRIMADKLVYSCFLLITISKLVSDTKTGLELAWQLLTMPIFRVIGAVFLSSCNGIVEKCRKEEEEGSQGVQKKENADQVQESRQ